MERLTLTGRLGVGTILGIRRLRFLCLLCLLRHVFKLCSAAEKGGELNQLRSSFGSHHTQCSLTILEVGRMRTCPERVVTFTKWCLLSGLKWSKRSCGKEE